VEMEDSLLWLDQAGNLLLLKLQKMRAILISYFLKDNKIQVVGEFNKEELPG
jgi:hypothetical protein